MALLSRSNGGRCADCGTSLEGRGNRAVRCEACSDAHHAQYERDRWHRRKTSLRRAPVEGDDLEPQEVVKFGGDGRSQPPRQLTTRTQAEREDRLDELQPQTLDRERWVRFEPVCEADRGYDHLGRPSRERPDRYGGMIMSNLAAAGILHAPRTVAIQRAVLAAKVSGRFGPNVEAPEQPHAGQYESNTVLTQQEEVAAQIEQVQHQAASNHYGAQLPGWRS